MTTFCHWPWTNSWPRIVFFCKKSRWSKPPCQVVKHFGLCFIYLYYFSVFIICNKRQISWPVNFLIKAVKFLLAVSGTNKEEETLLKCMNYTHRQTYREHLSARPEPLGHLCGKWQVDGVENSRLRECVKPWSVQVACHKQQQGAQLSSCAVS